MMAKKWVRTSHWSWICLVIFAHSQQSLCQEDAPGIHNPFEIERVPPPNIDSDEDVLSEDLNRMRSRRQKRELKENPPVPRKVIKQQRLIQEAQKNKNHRVHFQVSFIAPFASTDEDRENYLLDYTSHFQFFWRVDGEIKDFKNQLWLGLRIAPFSGSGVYKGSPGRFGYTYFGPSVGFGKVNIPGEVAEKKKGAREKKQTLSYPARYGYFFMVGVAGQSRIVETYAEDESAEQPFKSQDFAFDSPGVWAELTLFSLLYESFSYNFIMGIQTGEGKNFTYAGIGMGAWH